MGQEPLAQHFVCTHTEARDIVARQSQFWVANCGCREARGSCARSRIDVCLEFQTSTAASGSGRRPIDRNEVEAILAEAAHKGLVSRPFRDKDGEVEGICFCCDCCCGYFVDAEETCDPGASIETTELSLCNDCGACVDSCYFGARALVEGKLEVQRDLCYGCGLCLEVCAAGAIALEARR